jgi:hypothetical protein
LQVLEDFVLSAIQAQARVELPTWFNRRIGVLYQGKPSALLGGESRNQKLKSTVTVLHPLSLCVLLFLRC